MFLIGIYIAYLLIFLFYCMACLVLPVHDGLSVLSKGSNPTFHFQVGEVIFKILVIPLHHLFISIILHSFVAGYSNNWTS